MELLVDGEPGERFRYRAGDVTGDSPDIDAARSGDELVLGPETTLVLRAGRPYASLSGRAFLWWHQRAFQADFWKALTALRGAVPQEWDARRRPPGAAGPVRESAPRSYFAPSAAARLNRLFARVDQAFQGRHGFSSRSRHDGEFLRVSLRDGGFEFFLIPRELRREGFFALLPSFYVRLHGKTALTSAEQDLLRSYLSVLAEYDGELKSLVIVAGKIGSDAGKREVA
jgi:hypothetical protein